MASQFSFVLAGGTGEYIEKKSRFIGELRPIKSQEEASAFLQETRKKHHDARHHCMAWVLGGSAETKHSSDDGEPSGTAGRPILSVLEGAHLTNAALIVTRYFGGTLLGTGGLVRSYTNAAQAALEDALIVRPQAAFQAALTAGYAQWPQLDALFRKEGIYLLKTDFAENVRVQIACPIEDEDRIRLAVESILKSSEPFEERRSCQISPAGKELIMIDEEGLRRIPLSGH